jgi:BolA family transcriptional regulator, general stress-responsive regulator
MSTVELIRQKLAVLDPEQVEIVDESAKHAGHEGARQGGGHYFLTIVSRKFFGKSTLIRHRLVYTALREMMHKDIHALSVKAYTPEEIRSNSIH